MLNHTRNKNKIHTLRTKRYGNNGDILKIHGTEEYIKFVSVQRIPIDIVADYLYKCEGCSSKDHFIATWERIHPEKGYCPQEKYWGHFYVYLGDEPDFIMGDVKKYAQSKLI